MFVSSKEKKKLNIRPEIIKIILVAALIRVVTYLIYLVFMKYSPEHGMPYSFENILNAWRRWDANAYLDLAQNGYNHYQENGQHLYLVFLPLYPWVVRMFALVLRSYELAGLFVSFISILIGCVFLYIIVEEDYGYTSAVAAVISLSLFPFAFFLNGIMTDSLFTAIVLAFMFYLKKKRYGMATLFGFLACLCRLQGWFLAFAIVVELWEDMTSKSDRNVIKDFILPGIKCLPMLFGVIIYLFINLRVEGDPFVFLTYQKEHWTHTFGPFWNCVRDMITYINADPSGELSISIWWPQLILFAVQLVFIIYCVRIKMRPSYIVIFIAFFIVTYSSTWLLSGSRYTLSVAPLFMAIGVFLSRHRVGKWIWYVLSFALMVTYMWRFYNYMSIM